MSLLIRRRPAVLSSLRLFNKSLISRWNVPAVSVKSYSTSKGKESVDPQLDHDEPIKYKGSKASTWTSKRTRSGTVNADDLPGIQMYSVVGSVAIFLIYFCYLREENDIDEEMGKTLYERIPGLEQTQLIINYKYNLENNVDNGPIVARMEELGMRLEDIKM